MSRSRIARPTEVAALRAVARSARPTRSVPALMAALLVANERRDREGVQLCAHRVVRASEPEVGEA
ncbi:MULTISPECIES: hypothetical protein [unclassified Streptomyces]|uniref:hypothetical protein n=1 Tax=unclassified Streptomyces TaxID=2593676 RepID=UPI0029A1DC65|nr:hypothetical protein [Streptomyces sp. FL07-04A]MDX3578642.1 hypothetical protein [Streptomyces sp. FL07-04A]